MDISALAPTESNWAPARRGRKPAEKGANPFLTNGWLLQSFESGKAQAVTVEGHFEEVDKNNRKGEAVTRRYVRGDAGEVIKLIREAAEELTRQGTPMGVAVNPVAARKRGFITIHYLGQKRKARKDAQD